MSLGKLQILKLKQFTAASVQSLCLEQFRASFPSIYKLDFKGIEVK